MELSESVGHFSAVTEILPTASYLRTADRTANQSVLHSPYEQRVWELLQTPQTIETICRVLANEYGLSGHSCSTEVRTLLAHLYREGLIQVSPDS